MIARFLRTFFWSLLVGSLLAWLYAAYVRASAREAILVEDRYTGLDPSIILPGDVRMLWQRVQPGRVTLHRLDLGPRVLNLRYRRPLRQSEQLGLDEAFYIKADLRIEFSIDPARASELFLRLERPDWDLLDDYLSLRVALLLDRQVDRLYPNEAALPGLLPQWDAYLSGPAVADINAELSTEGLSIRRALPVRLYVPDAGRYQAMLQNAPQILAQKLDRIRVVDDARAQLDASRIKDQAYSARLRQLGDILERYPHLQGYVTIDRLGDQVQVYVLPSDSLQRGAPLDAGDLIESRRAAPPPRASTTPAPAPVQNGAGGARFQDLTPP